MHGHVSLTFPEGPRLITMVLSPDGAVHVERRTRVGALVDRAEGQVTEQRARRVLSDLLIASKLGIPGVEIVVAMHDAHPPDPAVGETTHGSVLDSARELGREILRRHGTRPQDATYGPLAFLKWTLAFGAVLAATTAIAEWVARETGAGLIASATNPVGANFGGGIFVVLVLLPLGFGVVKQRFLDAHRSDAHPLWPALVATVPFFLGAYSLAGAAGLFYAGAFLALPLLLVALGLSILNPSGRTDREHSWFNWRGWY